MPRIRVPLRGVIRRGLVFAVVVAACCVAADAWACPTCKEDLANSPQARGLASGFYYSILLMMSMPFAIIGTLGALAYRSVKRAEADRAAQADADLG